MPAHNFGYVSNQKSLKKNMLALFCGWGSTVSRLQNHYGVTRGSWYSFDQPRKNERLSFPLSHPEALNPGPLDWESSAPTTILLLHADILRMLSFFEI